MFVCKVRIKHVLMVLTISGTCIWSQISQATNTIQVNMAGVIQAPAVSKNITNAGAGSEKIIQATDNIYVTMTGIIQAPAKIKKDAKTNTTKGIN